MGPDARCAVGVHCEKWWLSGGPHPQRRLYLLVGDPAPFGLSCGGRCSGRLEEAGRVEVIGAPHCEHSVGAGATVVLDVGGCAHTISDPLILSHKVNDFSQSLPSGTITIREVQ